MLRNACWAVVLLWAGVAPALAHTGYFHASGFTEGLTHPVGGVDHMLAMVAVGLLAVQIGGRAIWALPGAFLSMMVAGGVLGLAGLDVPFVEAGIALSAVAFGIAVALRIDIPVAIATALVGAFAVFHGHAHGAEMPIGASALAYASGFVLATAVLHGIGIALGFALARTPSQRLIQAAGCGTALAGMVLFAKLI